MPPSITTSSCNTARALMPYPDLSKTTVPAAVVNPCVIVIPLSRSKRCSAAKMAPNRPVTREIARPVPTRMTTQVAESRNAAGIAKILFTNTASVPVTSRTRALMKTRIDSAAEMTRLASEWLPMAWLFATKCVTAPRRPRSNNAI